MCTFSTIALTIKSIFTFYADEDATVVSYKNFFHDENAIAPSTSICISAAFEEHKLKSYSSDITLAKYSDFLGGIIWDKAMLNIDYEEVRLAPIDYILGYRILYKNTSKVSKIYRKNRIENEKDIILPEIRLAMSGMVCFGIDIPLSKEIIATTIKLKANIFHNGIRPTLMDPLDNKRGIGIVFHYPNQIYRASWWKNFWPRRSKNSSKTYQIALDTRGMEVVRYRNKPHQPCKEGFPNYDEDVSKTILAKEECRPPYVTTFQNLCSNQTSLKNIRSKLVDLWNGVDPNHLPCNGMEKVNYEVTEYDLKEANPAYLELIFLHRELTYKEVKMIRAFDLAALVGNTGGGVGLVL